MIKRDITETIFEYDTAGNLVKKTVIETHEEDTNVTQTESPHTYKSYPHEIVDIGGTAAVLLSTTTAKN